MRLSLALLLLASPAFAQQPMPPAQPAPGVTVSIPQLSGTATSLLDGRIMMHLPVGMQVVAAQGPAAAADPQGRNEARAELTIGQTRFAVMAEEMYATAPADLVAAVSQLAQGEKPEAIAVPSGLKVVGFEPQHGPPPGDMDLLYATWVVHPDGHVIQVGFLASAAAMSQRAAWVWLAEQALRTIAPGPRKLELGGGERVLGTTDKLALNLPASWTTSTSSGPDFTVYHLRKVGLMGAPQPTCGIYVGNHPNPFRQRMNGQGTTAQGVLLGQRTDWFSFVGQRGEHTTEAIVAHPLHAGLWVHVFCTAADDAQLKPVRASVDTLRIAR